MKNNNIENYMNKELNTYLALNNMSKHDILDNDNLNDELFDYIYILVDQNYNNVDINTINDIYDRFLDN